MTNLHSRKRSRRHHQRNSRLLRVPLITACIAAFGLAGSAAAATQVGQVSNDPGAGGCMSCAFLQVATDSSATYAMPADGVLTSWRFHANAKPGTAHLRVYRPAATPGEFELVARTPDRAFALNEEAAVPTRLPVKAGDRIGVGVGGPSGAFDTGDFDDQLGGVPFFVSMGSVSSPNIFGASRANIAATLEADADKDGFGDETQDGCPGDPTTQASCTGASDSGSPAPAPGAPGAPAVDSSAPILALAAPRRESVKRSRLFVYAKSNEAAAGVVTGRVRIGRSARSYRLGQANASLAAGSRKKLVVRIPKRPLLAIRAALRAGRSPRALLTVLARDAAGNPTKAVKRIRLVR
jgi:hypothetical protein